MTPTGELGKIDMGQVSNFRTVQNGIYAIDMPDFYLAHTETTTPSVPSLIHTGGDVGRTDRHPPGRYHASFRRRGRRLYARPAVEPLRRLIRRVKTTSSRSVWACRSFWGQASSSTRSTATRKPIPPRPRRRSRLRDLPGHRPAEPFQANAITGNTTAGPGRLAVPEPDDPHHRRVPGGTFVISQGGAATGQIGTVRVGGAATNFTTFVTEDPLDVAAAEGQLDAKISNFYIGGQTDNVLLLAPSGSRNISFGLGMDNVTINSLTSSRRLRPTATRSIPTSRSAARSATC